MVTGVVPVQKWMASAAENSTVAEVAPAIGPAKMPSAELTPTIAPVKVAAAAPVTAVPTLTKNDVIAASFAALPADLQKPAVAIRSKPTATDAPLSKRVVRVVAVRPDGTPMTGSPMVQAYADNSWAPPVSDIPALDAAASIGAGQTPAVMPVALPKPVKVASVGKAPVAAADDSGKSAVITGSGANVRSAPTKGANKVLFALAGGTKVSVSESKRGWLHVTDDKGRSGWVYSDYVKR
jgi:hypothetical protein